jgi:diguanylate cyclase
VSLQGLHDRIEEIKFLLSDLFQSAASVENGRDPLTRTLNRRFLPSVLTREVILAKGNDLPLCVALVDVDHFKRVNDRFGHATGDWS